MAIVPYSMVVLVPCGYSRPRYRFIEPDQPALDVGTIGDEAVEEEAPPERARKICLASLQLSITLLLPTSRERSTYVQYMPG